MEANDKIDCQGCLSSLEKYSQSAEFATTHFLERRAKENQGKFNDCKEYPITQ